MSDSRFAVLMALIVACAPFALDAYLPAIPYMAKDLGVSTDQIATTISIFILGLALGQLIGGPLSDRFSRHKMIFLGLSIFAISSAVISQAQHLWLVQLCRFIQAIGGGFATVCVPALIRQRATGTHAAKLFSLVGVIMVAVPAIAPTIGAGFIALSHWSSIFYLLTLYPLLVIVLLLRFLPKEMAVKQPNVSAFKRYALVLRHSSAMRFLLAQSLAFSVMIVFVTNASFIYQKYFELSDQQFATLFGSNIIMMAIINRINSRKLNQYSPCVLLKMGLLLQLCAVFVMVLTIAIEPSLFILAACIILSVGAHGAISPNSNALYISHFSEHTGSASALLGASQFIMGGLAGGLSTWLFNGTLWPVFVTMLLLSLSANVLLITAPKSMVSRTQ